MDDATNYLMLDSSIVDTEEEKIILTGLLEFKKLFPGVNISLSHSSADKLVKKARRIRHSSRHTQIDANSLLEVVHNCSPSQITEVLFTTEDLATEETNFCFGATWLGGRCTVQSTHRYRGLNSQDRELVIKGVLHHELGHILGMAANLSRSHTEDKLGPHCADWNCIMHQSMNVNEAVRIARGARAHGRIYCPLCLADAGRNKI